MSQTDFSISLANPDPDGLDNVQKVGVGLGFLGLFLLVLSIFNVDALSDSLMFWISISAIFSGIVIFGWRTFMTQTKGIKNNRIWFRSLTSRGVLAWIFGVLLTAFYVILYWFPEYLGYQEKGSNTGLVGLFDPLSMMLKAQPASQWFMYGVLYTLAILGFGFRYIFKYRHSGYQIIRTISVMFFQLGFAFLIPELIQALNKPYYNFANMWPLNYYFFDEWQIKDFLNSGTLGLIMLGFGLAMIFIISPLLTFFYGKRWFCSWVCGCGGLAETAGDSFRQLSDKSLLAWRIERIVIHGVLVFVVVATAAVIYSYLDNEPFNQFMSKTTFVITVSALIVGFVSILLSFKGKELAKDARYAIPMVAGVVVAIMLFNHFTGNYRLFFIDNYSLRSAYGFAIGAAFSGVIGVGFYPIFGSRVWCRFGCPMAAILGIQQKFFSRFRISTNGGQCISCGNCSTYCEMGIDVRAYAQRGENIVRASCVGCGVCSAVCPRGVLNLENGPVEGRTGTNPLVVEDDKVTLKG